MFRKSKMKKVKSEQRKVREERSDIKWPRVEVDWLFVSKIENEKSVQQKNETKVTKNERK